MHHRRTITRLAAVAVLTACVASIAGCAAPAPACPPPPTGVYVAVRTLESIAPGTERRTVVALLGEPNRVVRLEPTAETPGDELWTWCCDAIEARTGKVLLLTRAEPAATSSTARITFAGGRVLRAWVESPAAQAAGS
ncbi:hypothetical protein Pla163_35210 [Planctomycetes bacterium Pla163]|uniref:Lipoprotein n=1 Tax=Rohdeia mirabilis TaxID=2528008 RepID=A0A518D4H5_9BACT|nr:hypothetical protein Pla163_35210 [Planctomycetes bacterium Pla163]